MLDNFIKFYTIIGTILFIIAVTIGFMVVIAINLIYIVEIVDKIVDKFRGNKSG